MSDDEKPSARQPLPPPEQEPRASGSGAPPTAKVAAVALPKMVELQEPPTVMAEKPTDQSDPKRKSHLAKFGLVELFIVALISTLLGAIGAEHRFLNDASVHLTIPAQPPIIVQSAPEIALGVIFFQNGKATVTADSQSAVTRWAIALRECPNAHFIVRGTASSVPFRRGSRGNNVKLANDRADIVAGLLKEKGVQNATPDHISAENDLIRVRRFNDHPAIHRSPKLEEVARRADIFFDDFGGCQILPQTK